MRPQIAHNTVKYMLIPTPNWERALDEVVWRCRDLYNVALEQRIAAWQRRHVALNILGLAQAQRSRPG
jgi:hypothetical protein